MVSSDSRARLDSVCASKRAVDVIKLVVPTSLSETEYTFNDLEEGQELFLNVIAVKDDEQITVPYQPVSLISL